MLISALLGMLGAVAVSGQTNVYSLNVVGYVNYWGSPGYSLITVPLSNSPDNDPTSLMDNRSGQFDGCTIQIWTNGGFVGYVADHQAGQGAVNGWVEPQGTILLNPGVGAVLYNPHATNVWFTIVGEVPEGSLTNILNPGLNLVGSIIPASEGMSTNSIVTFPSPANGQMDGDELLMLYNAGSGYGYTIYTADSLNYNPPTNYGWDGPPGAGQPMLSTPAQGFWYRAGNQQVQWVEQWSISGAEESSVMTAKQRRSPAKLSAPSMAKGGHFQMRVKGKAGKAHVVEASSDLKTWKPVTTNHISSATWVYKETEPSTNKVRFYRAYILP
jgi:hypothetical protein